MLFVDWERISPLEIFSEISLLVVPEKKIK